MPVNVFKAQRTKVPSLRFCLLCFSDCTLLSFVVDLEPNDKILVIFAHRDSAIQPSEASASAAPQIATATTERRLVCS